MARRPHVVRATESDFAVGEGDWLCVTAQGATAHPTKSLAYQALLAFRNANAPRRGSIPRRKTHEFRVRLKLSEECSEAAALRAARDQCDGLIFSHPEGDEAFRITKIMRLNRG